MVIGDIPVGGSAATGRGTQETFTIHAQGEKDSDHTDFLTVRTHGKDLQITVFTGTETFGPKPLDKHNWRMTIEEKP